MKDRKPSIQLLLWLVIVGIAIAGFGVVILSQVVFQPRSQDSAVIAAPGIAAFLASSAALVVALVAMMFLWGQIRALFLHQRQVQEKLRERNEFIETILDNMPIGLSVITFDDRTIRYMNRKAEEIVGWPLELINDHEHFWQSAIPDPAYRAQVVGKLDRDLEQRGSSQMVWEVQLKKHSGETAVNLWTSIPMFERNLFILTAQDFTEQRRAEEALRQSEMDRVQLQTELNLAAEVQRKLLPVEPPTIPGLQIAAFCLPARRAGGDFYDWQETAPGVVTVIFGDVMGKGMAAAMLMATVRAVLRAVTRGTSPSVAVHLAQEALWHDLNGSERFVTLFMAKFNVATGSMTYVDCGHGFVFLRRRDGTVDELLPRGLPLGISADEAYQEGSCVLHEGDALILYSDGLLEAGNGMKIDHEVLSERVTEASHARQMVELIAALVEPAASLPDDTTILVMRRGEEG